ncbi:MAG: MBL fold metallo-hydrolase, partial [Actinomycetales bacterium]
MSEFIIVPIETPNLGDRSYVIGRGDSAVVIDPQRDIDRVQAILDEQQWSVSHVLETHFHNDYVSGGLALAPARGAEYVVPAGMEIAFRAQQVDHGHEIDTDTAQGVGHVVRGVAGGVDHPELTGVGVDLVAMFDLVGAEGDLHAGRDDVLRPQGLG